MSHEASPAKQMKTPSIEHFYTLLAVFDSRNPDPERYVNSYNDPFPRVPRKWYFLSDDKGVRLPHVMNENNTISEKCFDELVRDVSEYCKFCEVGSTFYHWDAKKLADAARFISIHSNSVLKYDQVDRVSWKSDNSLSFFRLPFDRKEITIDPMSHISLFCPIFYEFLSRFESKKQAVAYCAWLGSVVLDKANKVHRGVILYGEGRNGKSAQLRMLDAVFGNSIVYKNCGDTGAHSSEGLERARIVVYADVGKTTLFGDAITKSLVGGDKIEMNMKSIRQFTVKPLAKVIACTNKLPNIRDNIAEKRRWIFCSIGGFAGPTDEMYQEKLDMEASDIFSACCGVFETNRDGGDIVVDESALDEVTEAADADVKWFCDNHFIIASGGRVISSEIAAMITARGGEVTKDRAIGYLKKHFGAFKSSYNDALTKKKVNCYSGVSLTREAKMVINFQTSAECN